MNEPYPLKEEREKYAKERATGFLIWFMTGGFIAVLFKTVDKAYDYYLKKHTTMSNQKEELRKKFDEECRSIINTTNLPMVVRGCLDRAFNHLYSEIEARDKKSIELSLTYADSLQKDYKAKITHLQELLKAADNVIEIQATSLRTYGAHPIIEGQVMLYQELKTKNHPDLHTGGLNSKGNENSK